MLLAVCASLLALLLTSGIMAVRFLGQMYAREAAVWHALTERTQMLVGLWASVQSYRQAVESFVAKAPADRDQVARRHLDQLGLEVDMELQRYPSQEDSTETALVRSIEDAFHRQRDFYIAIVTASQLKQFPVERNAIAARQPSDEEMILIWPARLSMWNGERLQNADRTLLAQFANVQNGLTRALVLAFGSGLLLASAGLCTSCGSNVKPGLGTSNWHEVGTTCRNSLRNSWMRKNRSAALFRENSTMRLDSPWERSWSISGVCRPTARVSNRLSELNSST